MRTCFAGGLGEPLGDGAVPWVYTGGLSSVGWPYLSSNPVRNVTFRPSPIALSRQHPQQQIYTRWKAAARRCCSPRGARMFWRAPRQSPRLVPRDGLACFARAPKKDRRHNTKPTGTWKKCSPDKRSMRPDFPKHCLTVSRPYGGFQPAIRYDWLLAVHAGRFTGTSSFKDACSMTYFLKKLISCGCKRAVMLSGEGGDRRLRLEYFPRSFSEEVVQTKPGPPTRSSSHCCNTNSRNLGRWRVQTEIDTWRLSAPGAIAVGRYNIGL